MDVFASLMDRAEKVTVVTTTDYVLIGAGGKIKALPLAELINILPSSSSGATIVSGTYDSINKKFTFIKSDTTSVNVDVTTLVAGFTKPGDSGLFPGVAQYASTTIEQFQLIETNIPISSSVMVRLDLVGFPYGAGGVTDLSLTLYAYSDPAGANMLYNPTYTTRGTINPANISGGFVNGKLVLAIDWGSGIYYNRYVINAYATVGSGYANPGYFTGWKVSNGLLPVEVTFNKFFTNKRKQITKEELSPDIYSIYNSVDAQTLLQLDGRFSVSKSGDVSWTNRFITIGLGKDNSRDPEGHRSIYMPAVGTNISVSGGSPRLVNPAVAGDPLTTGGIMLIPWEALWVRVTPGSAGSGVGQSDYLIQPYNVPDTVGLTKDNGWVLICQRVGSTGAIRLGTGDVCPYGGSFGKSMDLQRQIHKGDSNFTVLDGQAFCVYNSTTSLTLPFGFSGQLQHVGAGGTNDQFLTNERYLDIYTPAVGTLIRGWDGLPDLVWRAQTTDDQIWRFGDATSAGLLPVTSSLAVFDFPEYATLYWVPNRTGTGTGGWYYANHATANIGGVIPNNFFAVAHRNTARSGAAVILWNGTHLQRGEVLARGTRDALLTHAAGTISSTGEISCRFTESQLFTGIGTNGWPSGAVSGVYVGWPNESMMWGMDTGVQNSSSGFLWINVPPDGTEIKVLEPTGKTTRKVKNFGGINHVPLSSWENLQYIPAQVGGPNATTINGWVISDHRYPRQLPSNCITVASWADGGLTAAGVRKTKIKMGDGTYVSPGVIFGSVGGVYGDHAQGSTAAVRPMILAGGTQPGGVGVFGTLLANVAGNGLSYRLETVNNGSSKIVLHGKIQANVAIPDGTEIVFLPGVYTASKTILLYAQRGTNNSVASNASMVFVSARRAEQEGTVGLIYGYGPGNIAGGPYGPGGFISLDGIILVHE